MVVMRTAVAAAAVAAILSAVPAAARGEDSRGGARPGAKAPDFTLKTHDGRSLTLSKLRGRRGVVLVFFATWCPSCMAEVPRIKEFVAKTKDAPVLVYGVNIKQPERVVDRFVAGHKVNYRILLDSAGEVARKYHVRGIPLIVGIDSDGIVRYRGHGIPRDAAPFVKELTRPLAKVEPR